MMHNVYTGEKVRIRPYRDIDEMHRVMAAEDLEPNDHWGVWHYTLPEQRRDFADSGLMETDKYSSFAIERLDTGECIGYEEFGGMNSGSLNTWVGTFIMVEHRGNRFGVEAKQLAYCYIFENYTARMVFADTVATHLGARRGLELSGMRFIGARRKAHYRKGEYVDVVLYQLLRSEWERLEYRHSVRRG
jgi:RimJ/RimL family protein N-acetyltransferase